MASYEFYIDDVNITGKPVPAMVIDGNIPGPTIQANLNDTLKITFNNQMDVETSIHWHGVLLPNDQDGVPYLTTPPISRRIVNFRIPRCPFRYWYHYRTQDFMARWCFATRRHIITIRNWSWSYWTDEHPGTVEKSQT